MDFSMVNALVDGFSSLSVLTQLVLALGVYILFLSLLVRWLHVQSKSEKTGQAQVPLDSGQDSTAGQDYLDYPGTGGHYDYSNGNWGHWSRWRR